ncbi:MAG: tRNA 2-selenouridine(34) synthase MnmH [Pseudomonadota bacterium]
MRSFTLHALSDIGECSLDTIIDVRAPIEFAEDHIPGAINLPVLSDAERARVGTIYTRQSPFLARKIGGALVAQNTAMHVQGPLAEKAGDWQPLIYCWRGGQRSGAFGTILDQIGWRVHILKGGYRSYRQQVVHTLYSAPLPHRLMLLDGGTGTAKTEMLSYLAEAGAQILDLEALAAHRGSLFGELEDAQPSQKLFETRIASKLCQHSPHQITWVEAESSRIGERIVPPALWKSMRSAPRVRLSAALKERAHYLCKRYADLTTDAARLNAVLDQLCPYQPAETISTWRRQADQADWRALAEGLIQIHYDPRYKKSVSDHREPYRCVELKDLTEECLRKNARMLAAQIK